MGASVLERRDLMEREKGLGASGMELRLGERNRIRIRLWTGLDRGLDGWSWSGTGTGSGVRRAECGERRAEGGWRMAEGERGEDR